MKTVRKLEAHEGYNQYNFIMLQVKGRYIKWEQLRSKLTAMWLSFQGLVPVPKLNIEHLDLRALLTWLLRYVSQHDSIYCLRVQLWNPPSPPLPPTEIILMFTGMHLS
jgi:hypothetical protein